MFESIKVLEIKASMLFSSVIASNTILLCFFLFLIIDFLIPAVIAQLFNPIAELTMPIGIPTKEASVYPVTGETKISKCSV